MALPASPPLSMTQIATEFGGSLPHSISEYYGAAAGVPASGTLSFTDFLGKSAGFTVNLTVSTTVYDYNIRAQAIAAGWDQVTALSVTLTNTGNILSTNTATPALRTGSSFPAGSSINIINNGLIAGRPGAAGAGGWGGSNADGPWYATGTGGYYSAKGGNAQPNTTSGGGGGVGFLAEAPCSFTNNGTIGGGPGGGGGGSGGSGSGCNTGSNPSYGPGGKGGDGGNGGFAFSGCIYGYSAAASGQSGTVQPYDAAGATGGNGGSGGAGGANWGQAGTNGVGGSSGTHRPNSAAGNIASQGDGGSAGAAVSGNSNVAWVAAGTRLGALV